MKRTALVISLCVGLMAHGETEVFRAQTTLNGSIERGAITPFIARVVISTDDLINLAQSRPLGTPVPRNEILALTGDCTNRPLQLIVFDTLTGSNQVTVGSFTNLARAISQRKRFMESISRLDIHDISVPDTNGIPVGITGGSFYYRGRINTTTNNCPTRYGGQLTGFLGTSFASICTSNFCTNVVSCVTTNCMTNEFMQVTCETNCTDFADCSTVIPYPCADQIDVVIPRAPLVTGRAIATIPEPEE